MGLNLYESLPYNITASGGSKPVTGRGRFTGMLITAKTAVLATIDVWDFGNQRLMPTFNATSNTTDGIQFANPIQVKNGISANLAGTDSATIYFVSSPA
jgi:hypothetical protein